MKSEGYGGGYEYDHDTAGCFFGTRVFPDALGTDFYDPPDRGFERGNPEAAGLLGKLRRERVVSSLLPRLHEIQNLVA